MNAIQLAEVVAERKARLTKGIEVLKYKYNPELVLAIEGRGTNLRIWICNEKCLAEGGGKRMIYMRLDCYNQYSTPLDKESVGYLLKESEPITALLKFGFCSDIECLDEILEITKKMKERSLMSW